MSLGLEKLLLTNQAQKEKDVNWFFSRERIENGTPSRLRGMSYEDEIKLRRSTVRFLHKLSEVSYSHRNLQANSAAAAAAAASARSASHNGNRFETIGLGVGNFNRIIFATASVWFHRFFMVHPLQVFDSYEIAATCFYLATKVEDQSLSLGYIVACSQRIMEWSGVPICHTAEQMEEELKDLESCLMMTLGFIVWVRHPYPYIGQLVEQLIGEKEQVERIAKVATQYVTDSLGSIFCVRIDPRKLAIASITWACQELSFPLNNWKNKSGAGEKSSVLLTHWVESFNLKLEDVRKLFGEYAEHVRRDTVEKEDDGENGALLQHGDGEERLILRPLVDPRRRPPPKQQVHEEVLEPGPEPAVAEPEPVVALDESINSMPTLSPPPSSLRPPPSSSTPPIPILHPHHHEQEQLIIPHLIIMESADPNSNGSFTTSSSNSSSSLDNNPFENLNINIQFPIDFDLDLNLDLDLDLDFDMRKRKKIKMDHDHSVNSAPRDTNTK